MNSDGRTHAAGEVNANPSALFSMHGNVWEWVQDWWEPNYYAQFRRRPQQTRQVDFGRFRACVSGGLVL